MKTIASAPLLSGSILARQIELEARAVQSGVARYRLLAKEAVDRGEGASLKPAERLLLYWFEPFESAIRRDQRQVRKLEKQRTEDDKGSTVWGPIITNLDAAELAVIAMHETVSRCMASPGGTPVTELAHAIGRAVIAEETLQTLKENDDDAYDVLTQKFREATPKIVNWYARKHVTSIVDGRWRRHVFVQAGTRLLWLLIGCASSNDDGGSFRLAFHVERLRWGSRTQSIVRMDERLFKVIEEGHRARQAIRPRYLPMIVEPYPWQAKAQGGYVKVRTPLISKPTGTQKAAIERADLSEFYDCLNAVSSTPWNVDGFMLETMKSVYERGGNELEVPRREPWPTPPMPESLRGNDDAVEEWKKARGRLHRTNNRLVGDRESFHMMLYVADQMIDERAIYFPHQADFRTRCYPIPPHLNHQGNDLRRGLLRFADPKAPGPAGERWLKIHAANCWGFDKVSYVEREEWVTRHMEGIERSAESPLDVEWWKGAKKPWQFLAACRAIIDPESAARLPVQIDGTCNGLQHYTAMGRDQDAAALVNMIPSDRPNDVYSAVSETVLEDTRRRAKAGDPNAIRVLSHVVRDTVKQPVMTTVYGVTMIGARKQTTAALREHGLDCPKDQMYAASVFLSQATMRGIDTKCRGASTIMAWLRRTASEISSKFGRIVQWTSPLGFPVVQPYRKYRTLRTDTVLGSLTVMVEDESVPVWPARQINGMAPNFVHSIDATHMLRTARSARNEDVCFAGVHDSYWSHAADTDRLGRILREEFVDLHRQPLLDNLANELRQRYPEATIEDPPPPGTYDLEQVLRSPYFFS